MPNPRANRPLTLDQVTADLQDLTRPAFYPRVGNIRSRGVQPPQPMPMREQAGPEMPQWGEYDLSVPTQANRAMSQRLSEAEALENARASANMSPLEKAGAALQAARLMGSGITQLAMSMPTRIRSGDKAAEDYIAENIYKPTIPKAVEYASDLGEFLEQLETQYKLPPIMPELLPFQEMTGPAMRQLPKAAPRAAGVTGLGGLQMADQGFAGGGLLKGIKAIKKGATNAERSMPARGALRFADEPAGGPSVIKEKGGNWLGGDVEKQVGKLKMADTIPPEKLAEDQKAIDTAKRIMGDDPDVQRTVRQMENELQVAKRNNAINQWVDRNLTNYIKNQMATPDDPVRRLAEQGITHKSDLGNYRTTPGVTMGKRREQAGFPAEGMAQSDLAKQWENLTDISFMSRPAKDVSAERYPWVTKLDPETPVYGGVKLDIARELGFDHIVDVLRQDVREGRIRPEQLNKVSMEQAVRRAYEYDQEMARKMAEAQIKATEGMPVHKEYPEGYKWIELKAPIKEVPSGWSVKEVESPISGYQYQVYDDKNNEIVGAYGKTKESALKKAQEGLGRPELESALKYEGETMGHCVGGYCPDVLEGRSRIYSLRDKRGEPHVTVEVQSLRGSELGRYAADLPEGEDVAAMKNPPQKIVQIKGKGNRAPKEEYLPFVQDFVKGGKWSDVGDLQNTGLHKLGSEYLTLPEAEARYKPKVQEALSFLDTHPILEEHRIADKAYQNFSGNIPSPEYEQMQRGAGRPISENVPYTIRELRALLSAPEDWVERDETIYRPISTALEKINQAKKELGIADLPPDGMKHGGSVHISDNPDTMMMELGDQQFQVGGIVDAAARAAKAAKAAQLKKAMKASEALAQIEGKNLNITQADRTKVGEGLLGGPGFSGLQHQEGPHKDVGAVWGVKTPGTAKTMLGGLKNPLGNEYFTTMIGSPTQHQSNQMVFDKLYGKFKAEAKKGNLDPELQQKINERLASAMDKDGNPIFPPDVDILSKDFKKIANTFDRRAIAGNLIGGVGVGGRKGQIIDYDKIIRDTTDPFLLDMPSGSLGHRLWTPSGEIIERPDLHPAFPAIATGEDLGVEFTPASQDILMAPWIENVRQTKGRNPGYMDWTRGRPPSVRVTEDILRKLEESGNKEGGAIHVKKRKDDAKASEIGKNSEAVPMPVMMSAGGKLSKAAIEAIERMKAMRPEIAAKASLEQKALAENANKYTRDIQPLTITPEEIAAEMKRLESKGLAGGGEVNADDLILEERPL